MMVHALSTVSQIVELFIPSKLYLGLPTLESTISARPSCLPMEIRISSARLPSIAGAGRLSADDSRKRRRMKLSIFAAALLVFCLATLPALASLANG